MPSTSQDNKRIAKNTLLLYFRMILIMAVTLYTSRVVLDALGVEDFGIYNIVGGVVVLFSFLNSAMASATQRFLNYELGRGDIHEVQRVFSMSMTAHLSIAALVLVLAETVGLWFVWNYIKVPPGRETAAIWCYQFSVLTSCIQIVRIPYNACIIAYERMSFYAYISILEVVLRLLVVFPLLLDGFDRLVLYSLLMSVVALLVLYLYKSVCNRRFPVSRYRFFWDSSLYKKLMSFSGWSLFGGVANVGAQQGLGIVLNVFFGVAVNAAMGIANQVSQAVYSFVSNFQTAFNPQIIKSYAAGDRAHFEKLMFYGSKYSYFLLFLLSLPVLLNCDFLLSVWLKEVPPHAAAFSELIILFLLLDALSAPLWIAVQAMGNIRNYQLLISSIILLSLPLGYVALKLGMPPESVLVVRVVVNAGALAARIVYLYRRISFPAGRYLKEVVLSVLLVTACSVPLPLWLGSIAGSWIGLLLTGFASLLLVPAAIYVFGLRREERSYFLRLVHEKIKR